MFSDSGNDSEFNTGVFTPIGEQGRNISYTQFIYLHFRGVTVCAFAPNRHSTNVMFQCMQLYEENTP